MAAFKGKYDAFKGIEFKDKESMLDFYNVSADTYDKETYDNNYSGLIIKVDQIIKHVKEGGDTCILDVAAGSGILVEEINRRGFDVTFDGMDPSELAKKALEKNLYRNFYHEFLDEDKPCTLESGIYDHVTCISAILPGHIHYKCISELLRLCKKGGYVFVTLFKDHIPGVRTSINDVFDYVDQLVKDQLCAIVESFGYDNHYKGLDGYIYVLKKTG